MSEWVISVPKRKQFPAYSIAFKIIDRVNVSFGRFSIFVHIRKIFIVLRREINLVEDRVPFQAIRVGNLWVAKSFALSQIYLIFLKAEHNQMTIMSDC